MSVKPKCRRFQFSLRTLLTFMVVASVVMGLIARRWNQAHRQAAFVRDLGSFDDAKYDYEVYWASEPSYPIKFPWDAKSPYPQFLHNCLSKDVLHSIVSVSLWADHGQQARRRTLERMRTDLRCLRQLEIRDYTSNDELEEIVRITSLRSLLLHGIDVKSLPRLGRATQLENLEIRPNSISDDEIRPLMSLTNLRCFTIRGTGGDESASLAGPWLAAMTQLEEFNGENLPLDGRAAKHLAGLTNLKRLCLSRTRMDDLGLASIGQLTQLEELDLSETKITDEGLKYLTHLTALRHLKLDQTAITDRGVTHLAGLIQLEHLELDETDAGSNSLATLCRLPNLHTLKLDHSNVGDSGLHWLGNFRKLRHLSLRGTAVSDHGWRGLSWPTELRALALQETCVTQASLEDLLTCPTLLYLEVEESHFDSQTEKIFQQARPNGWLQLGYRNDLTSREAPLPGEY